MNILFLFADDFCRYAGCYAGLDGRPTPSDIVKTPNIDRLAHDGVVFRHAFVTAPSCTPCRSSLLSGQYFFRTGRGAILNGAVWDPSIPSFPHLLRDAGYHIGETYKVWSPGTPNDAPFGGGKNAYEKAGGQFNNFSENVTSMAKQGMPIEAAKLKLLDQVKGNFGAFLADRKPNQPWLYWFGPTNTHRKWEKGSGKALWGIEPESLKGKLPQFFPDVPEVWQDVADYLGEIQAWDAAIGVILTSLEAAGDLERTIIVVSGDHGAPGFPGGKCNLYDYGTNVGLIARVPGVKGGRVVDDYINLMDLAPTFCEIGGVKPPDVMTGKSALNVLKSDQSGQIDPTRTWVVTGRERHVATARADNLPYPQRALRTPEYLYIHNFKPDRWPLGDAAGAAGDKTPAQDDLENNTYAAFADMDASPTKAFLVMNRNSPSIRWFFEYAFLPRPEEELFDLKSDPQQVKNVAADPAYAKAKQEMSARLLSILKDAKDPRVTSGNDVPFEKPPFTDGRAPAGKRNAAQ
ncbi:sulfatase [Humisphaera borealis]|uniref:Sulfatase n=2 Tax=Humisphaera borealis TaxID=2807512 RepID=A0A7M2X4A2_9BACT|nr:sulfatase [Humisphaera borealis]